MNTYFQYAHYISKTSYDCCVPKEFVQHKYEIDVVGTSGETIKYDGSFPDAACTNSTVTCSFKQRACFEGSTDSYCKQAFLGRLDPKVLPANDKMLYERYIACLHNSNCFDNAKCKQSNEDPGAYEVVPVSHCPDRLCPAPVQGDTRKYGCRQINAGNAKKCFYRSAGLCPASVGDIEIADCTRTSTSLQSFCIGQRSSSATGVHQHLVAPGTACTRTPYNSDSKNPLWVQLPASALVPDTFEAYHRMAVGRVLWCAGANVGFKDPFLKLAGCKGLECKDFDCHKEAPTATKEGWETWRLYLPLREDVAEDWVRKCVWTDSAGSQFVVSGCAVAPAPAWTSQRIIIKEAKCPKGYERNVVWQTGNKEPVCTDIDECSPCYIKKHGSPCASEHAACVNNRGGYKCVCDPGYKTVIKDDKETCGDLDECEGDWLNECDPNAKCANLVGTYTCSCNAGWEGNGKTCTDFDECNSVQLVSAQPTAQVDVQTTSTKSTAAPTTITRIVSAVQTTQQPTRPRPGPPTPAPTMKPPRNGTHCGSERDPAACDDMDASYCTNAALPSVQAEVRKICPAKCDICAGVPVTTTTTARLTTTVTTVVKCRGQADPADCEKFSAGTCREALVGAGLLRDCPVLCGSCGLSLLTTITTTTETTTTTTTTGTTTTTTRGGYYCSVNSECMNDPPGSYRCDCIEGYQKSQNGFFCENVNECKSQALHTCDLTTSECVDNDGSFSCQCIAGFEKDGQDVTVCKDVNECAPGQPSKCDEHATCTNEIGSFACACNTPAWFGNGATCKDTDECAINPRRCGENTKCGNTDGSFECSCADGYTNQTNDNGQTYKCRDFNECTDPDADWCAPEEVCKNTIGNYSCDKCIPGYRRKLEGDVCTDDNECLKQPCPTDATCVNMPGYFTCKCNKGFIGSAVGRYGNGIDKCSDTNECDGIGTNACDAESTECANTVGNYTCRCKPGYTEINATACKDVNECLDSTLCHKDATCQNLGGGFNCACNSGYSGNDGYAGGNCKNIDECDEYNPFRVHDCDVDATCTETTGSYLCDCNQGYKGNGTYCDDINECEEDSKSCSRNARCDNTVGAFTCTCPEGFTDRASSGKDASLLCDDIDECALNTDNCAGDHLVGCSNTQGSFACDCDPTYAWDGRECSDADECALGWHNCDEAATCTDEIGSFTCACNDGWLGDGTSCNDVNECLETNPPACPNKKLFPQNHSACYNYQGSFKCDLDECSFGMCSENADCTNSDGSYTCVCRAGYVGSGVSCQQTSTSTSYFVPVANVTKTNGTDVASKDAETDNEEIWLWVAIACGGQVCYCATILPGGWLTNTIPFLYCMLLFTFCVI